MKWLKYFLLITFCKFSPRCQKEQHCRFWLSHMFSAEGTSSIEINFICTNVGIQHLCDPSVILLGICSQLHHSDVFYCPNSNFLKAFSWLKADATQCNFFNEKQMKKNKERKNDTAHINCNHNSKIYKSAPLTLCSRQINNCYWVK